VKAHEETDCTAGYHVAHLGSLCDLCGETSWFLGTSVIRSYLGCRVLVAEIAQELVETASVLSGVEKRRSGFSLPVAVGQVFTWPPQSGLAWFCFLFAG
jgi:hypothetical protein